MSDLGDLEKALDELFEAAKTREERDEVWRFILGHIHEIYDDEEWATFRKAMDARIAALRAH